MTRIRAYYYSWYFSFFTLSTLMGLFARILLPDTQNFDAELALPLLSQNLLPQVLIGLILAGLFATTMSTADSQILSCSAAISNDLGLDKKLKTKNQKQLLSKFATIFITVLALIIATSGNKSVFALVMISWSILGSAFAPLLTILCFGGKPNEKTSILIMINGIACALIWKYLGLNSAIYEVAPGFLGGILTYVLASQVQKRWR